MNDRERRPPAMRMEIRGRAGRNAERKYSQAGKEYVRLSIAVDARKRHRDANRDERPKALWITVLVMRGGDRFLDQIASVQSGQGFACAGTAQLEAWTDRNRNPREDWTLFLDPDATTEINGKPVEVGGRDERDYDHPVNQGVDVDADDIPF